MKRYYFIGEDLQLLETVERELEQEGLTTPQIHVLSEDDAGVETRQLNRVEAVLKKDVVRATKKGAVVGAVGAVAVLLVAWATGISEHYTWVPAIFLAIVVLGFCTWEGGLIGIQEPHVDFRRFQGQLDAGKHILFVDVEDEQVESMRRVMQGHSGIETAGEGPATPRFVVRFQDKFSTFMKLAP